jgi:mycothiol synthase
METRTQTDARAIGPPGLELRAFTEADLAPMVETFNLGSEADGIEERIGVDDLRNWLGHPSEHFDAASDVVVAVVDDQVVGYGSTDWVDTNLDGLREYRSRGHVHPDWRRRRIGTAILAHNEARAREISARHDVDRPRVLGSWAADRRVGAVALMRDFGYQPVRYFFDMVRPTLDDIVVPPMPDGLEVRPVEGPAALRQLFDADVEAFMDHWGGFDASDASFRQWIEQPDFDPSLFVVAWDGDEITGGVQNIINAHENAALNRKRGLLDSVFVRRPWRRRGLASALVGRSLVALRDRGMTSAWLGVDADNPLGALGVYERAGFAVEMRATGYRKPMEMDR